MFPSLDLLYLKSSMIQFCHVIHLLCHDDLCLDLPLMGLVIGFIYVSKTSYVSLLGLRLSLLAQITWLYKWVIAQPSRDNITYLILRCNPSMCIAFISFLSSAVQGAKIDYSWNLAVYCSTILWPCSKQRKSWRKRCLCYTGTYLSLNVSLNYATVRSISPCGLSILSWFFHQPIAFPII